MLFALLGGRIESPTFPIDQTQPQSQALTQTSSQVQVQDQVHPEANYHPQSHPSQLDVTWKADPAIQYSQQDYSYAIQAAAGGYDHFVPETTETISAMEIWNRLQTFYEPTPAFWGMGEAGHVGGMYNQGLGAGWV